MRVRVKLAFGTYSVGQIIPEVPDPTAEDWIRRNLVERADQIASPIAANKPLKGGKNAAKKIV